MSGDEQRGSSQDSGEGVLAMVFLSKSAEKKSRLAEDPKTNRVSNATHEQS
jgi:hypothetical protein